MAFCTKCGTRIIVGSKFCHMCGAPVRLSGGVAPTVTSPSDNISTITPPPDTIPTFTPPPDTIPTVTPLPDTIPTFTPPPDIIPTFTPPTQPARHFDGPACYHHPDEPAAGQCARCGKYICKDCVEAYTVTDGDYANQSLCYDCCQELVSENVETLKKQKNKITVLLVITIIGMIIGFAEGVGGGIIAAIFCMLWFGSFWTWLKSSVIGWWNNPAGRSFAGFIGACIGGLIIAPYNTIKKIIECITYLKETSNFIEEDSAALVQMKEYMEYTQVMSRNKGVDLETLMGQGSELYNNSYAQMVSTQGEAAADAMLRQCTTRIAENGEIIRDFAI